MFHQSISYRRLVSAVLAAALAGCATGNSDPPAKYRLPAATADRLAGAKRHEHPCPDVGQWRVCLVTALAQFKLPQYPDWEEARVAVMSAVNQAAFGDHGFNKAWFTALQADVAQQSGGKIALEKDDLDDMPRSKGPGAYLRLVHQDGRVYRFTFGPYGQPTNMVYHKNLWMYPVSE